MLLIISHSEDMHALILEYACLKFGHSVTRLSEEVLPQKASWSLRLSCNESDRFCSNTSFKSGAHLKLSEISSVWLRRTAKINLNPALHPDDIDVAKSQFQRFSECVWGAIAPDARWVNPWDRFDVTENKAMQLQKARSCGFSVPDTLISNDPSQIRDFAKLHHKRGIIYKSFTPIGFKEEGGDYLSVSTTRLSKDHLTDVFALQNCPGIYQPYIEKSFELRVTVFGHHCITAKIDSQNMPGGETDWRIAKLEHQTAEPFVLPKDIAEICSSLLMSMGLAYGAIDLIVTPEGEYIFLEINPHGQFLWLEALCPDLPLLDTMVQYLVDGPDMLDGRRRYGLSYPAIFSDDSFHSFWKMEKASLENVGTAA